MTVAAVEEEEVEEDEENDYTTNFYDEGDDYGAGDDDGDGPFVAAWRRERGTMPDSPTFARRREKAGRGHAAVEQAASRRIRVCRRERSGSVHKSPQR